MERLLDDDADPARDEPGDPDEPIPPGSRRDPLGTVDRRARDHVRRDLDARDEVAGRDHLAVEHREHLERVDPIDAFDERRPDVDDAGGRGDQVHPAFGRSADDQARSGDGRGQPLGGLVLVDVAGLHDDQRDAGRVDRPRAALDPGAGSGQRGKVGGGEPTALRPALAVDHEVARQHRPGEVRSRGAARDDPFEPHPPGGSVAGGERRLDRPARLDPGHLRPVGRVGMDVGVRPVIPSTAWAAAAEIAAASPVVPRQRGLDRRGAVGDVGDPGDRDPGGRDSTRRSGRARRRRPRSSSRTRVARVAGTPSAAPAGMGRDPDLGEQLVVGAIASRTHPRRRTSPAPPARPTATGATSWASSASTTAGMSAAGSAWAIDAAERPAVADLDVADARDRQGQERDPARRQVGREDIGVGRHDADPETRRPGARGSPAARPDRRCRSAGRPRPCGA